jgi:hypothetical protein
MQHDEKLRTMKLMLYRQRGPNGYNILILILVRCGELPNEDFIVGEEQRSQLMYPLRMVEFCWSQKVTEYQMRMKKREKSIAPWRHAVEELQPSTATQILFDFFIVFLSQSRRKK